MFNVYLHAFTQPYGEEPVLSQAYYEITADVSANSIEIERFFRYIANEYANQYRDDIDSGTYGDFNWGDFIAEIPDFFLEENGVRMLGYGDGVTFPIDVQLFVEHDEHILDYD